jgi:hypothetical protein
MFFAAVNYTHILRTPNLLTKALIEVFTTIAIGMNAFTAYYLSLSKDRLAVTTEVLVSGSLFFRYSSIFTNIFAILLSKSFECLFNWSFKEYLNSFLSSGYFFVRLNKTKTDLDLTVTFVLGDTRN